MVTYCIEGLGPLKDQAFDVLVAFHHSSIGIAWGNLGLWLAASGLGQEEPPRFVCWLALSAEVYQAFD